jgi:hypothetical protein
MRNPAATLYQDMDGCLSDFYAMAQRVLGHPWDSKHLAHLQKAEQGLILNQHLGFWSDMPPTTDFHMLWSFIEKYRPHLLTAVPSWDHDFATVERGKWAWVQKHIPSLPRSRFHCVYRVEKQKYATNGLVKNLLVDDHIQNIKEFEAAGGIGIHHVSAKVTIIQLKVLGYH